MNISDERYHELIGAIDRAVEIIDELHACGAANCLPAPSQLQEAEQFLESHSKQDRHRKEP